MSTEYLRVRNFREVDGSVEVDGKVTLPISLGIPYNLAQLLERPTETATLRWVEPAGSTVREIWTLSDGRIFRTF